VVELVVPPLRDRKDDIPALAEEFGRRYGDRFGLGTIILEPALIDALVRADWPGNVRQLENTIARLAALSAGGVIGLADYQSASGEAPTAGAPTVAFEAQDAGDEHSTAVPDARNGPSLKEQVEAFERGLVARALDSTGGNQSEAARRLGVSRVTLIDKMKKYGLGPKR
jgi:two-component system response regulator AtoC